MKNTLIERNRNKKDKSILSNKKFFDFIIKDIELNTWKENNVPYHWYLHGCNITVHLNFYGLHRGLKPTFGWIPDCFFGVMSNYYGLTDSESELIWKWYKDYIINTFLEESERTNLSESDINKIIKKIKNKNLEESYGKQKKFLKKVLQFLVDDTIITSSNNRWVNIETPFDKNQYSRIQYFDSWDFVNYCMETYGLTKDESMILWGEYMNEINQILINEWGISDPVYH